MAQTTGGFVGVATKVEYSLNGSSWTDVSGYSMSVAWGGAARGKADRFTFDGDVPIVGVGKRPSVDITFQFVYTEGGADPFAVFWSAYENKTPIWFRWSPKGAVSGSFEFTSDSGFITACTPPVADASAADVVMLELVLSVAKVNKSTNP